MYFRTGSPGRSVEFGRGREYVDALKGAAVVIQEKLLHRHSLPRARRPSNKPAQWRLGHVLEFAAFGVPMDRLGGRYGRRVLRLPVRHNECL